VTWLMLATKLAAAAADKAAARPTVSGGEAMMIGLIAIGAALAIAIPALATAFAQSRIGAAMAGAVAERPELVGSAIIMVAIPETMVILGLVIAFMITTLKAGVK